MLRFFMALSRVTALVGGAVLTVLILITCLSILGRTGSTILHSGLVQSTMPGLAQWLLDHGVGPIMGDFELVEAGMATAIFAFLPLTQMTNGHASVDIFTNFLPDRVQLFLKMLIEILFAAALVIIANQLRIGMESKMRSGQTTFLLQFPIWWAYASALVPATIAAVVAVYVALVRVAEAFTGRMILVDDMGADH